MGELLNGKRDGLGRHEYAGGDVYEGVCAVGWGRAGGGAAGRGGSPDIRLRKGRLFGMQGGDTRAPA